MILLRRRFLINYLFIANHVFITVQSIFVKILFLRIGIFKSIVSNNDVKMKPSKYTSSNTNSQGRKSSSPMYLSPKIC